MDDEVRARLDAMQQTLDSATYALEIVMYAVLEDPMARMKVMEQLPKMLSDKLF